MSIRGHGEAVKHIRSYGIPLVLIGGGGYSLRNVARCWTYETSVALGIEIPNEIPENEYSIYYYPANKIHLQVSNQENLNKESEVEINTKKILENLKNVKATTVDYSYYQSGQPGLKDRPYLDYDKSENAQALADRPLFFDKSHDDKAE